MCAGETFVHRIVRLLRPEARDRHKPVERTDPVSVIVHEQLLAKAKQGKIDVYFEGDSITRRWGATATAALPPPGR